jgi:hypothetical protein
MENEMIILINKQELLDIDLEGILQLVSQSSTSDNTEDKLLEDLGPHWRYA